MPPSFASLFKSLVPIMVGYPLTGGDGFLIPENPLRKIVLGKAMVSSIAEKFELDVFDTSAIIHQISYNHDQVTLGVYIATAVAFYTYRNSVVNYKNTEEKLQYIDYYVRYKKIVKQVLFVLFFLLAKDVNTVL